MKRLLTVVMCHAGTEQTIARHLPIWRAHGGEILFFHPKDSIPAVHRHGHPTFAFGTRSHNGPSSIARFRALLSHLNSISAGYDAIVIQEYDSLILSPEFDYDPTAFMGNKFTDDPARRHGTPMFFHPPLVMSPAILKQVCNAMGNYSDDAGGGFWDNFIGGVVANTGIKNVGWGQRGFSHNTIEDAHHDAMRSAIKSGAVAIHGLKTADAINVALEAYAGARRSQRTKRVISYSLYGPEDAKKYWLGAVENAKNIEHNFPGWTMRIYYDSPELLAKCGDHSDGRQYALLKCAHHGAEIVARGREGDLQDRMTWRFTAIDDPAVDAMIVRDADSRLDAREKDVVEEWLVSGKAVHSILDHPAHGGRPLNGGLWGVRGGVLPNVEAMLRDWEAHDAPLVIAHDPDQQFLTSRIWPLVKDDCILHVTHCQRAFPQGKPFPAARIGKRFAGEVWQWEPGAADIGGGDEFAPRDGDWQQITEP